jgi:hypothetical protein
MGIMRDEIIRLLNDVESVLRNERKYQDQYTHQHPRNLQLSMNSQLVINHYAYIQARLEHILDDFDELAVES